MEPAEVTITIPSVIPDSCVRCGLEDPESLIYNWHNCVPQQR